MVTDLEVIQNWPRHYLAAYITLPGYIEMAHPNSEWNYMYVISSMNQIYFGDNIVD